MSGIVRLTWLFTAIAAHAALGGVARAQGPDKEACAVAHEDAQLLRKRGRLLEAKQKLIFCSQEGCPQLARADCADWLGEVDSSLPTVVIEAKDKAGARTLAVRVFVDGEPLREKLDGTALSVNPGEHLFRFEHEGAKPIEQKVLLLQGEHDRRIAISWELPAVEPVVVPPKPSPARKYATYGLAGLAVLGAASFTYFGVRGVSDENHLRGSCKPFCDPKDVDSVNRFYRIADVSLVIGVVAAGIAAYLFFTTPDATRPAPSRAAKPGARWLVPELGGLHAPAF